MMILYNHKLGEHTVASDSSRIYRSIGAIRLPLFMIEPVLTSGVFTSWVVKAELVTSEDRIT